MIYTTYFANARNLPANIEPISIAARPPRGWSGKEYKQLAPPRDVLSKYMRDKNEADYIQAYRKRVLNFRDPDDTVRGLHKLTDKDNIALVCYERPEAFCHRHLVADWLNEHGIKCLEWTGGGEKS